jgi:hypothetical protein
MMTQLPFVLLVLFAIPGDGHLVMETAQQFSSPLSCSMRAFIENEDVNDRTYVCVSRSHAALLLADQRTVRLGAANGTANK